jgi:hypothetical protein
MKDGEVACEVEWAKRYDGSQPLNSRVSNKDLKDKYPCLLIDYYETKLRPKTSTSTSSS